MAAAQMNSGKIAAVQTSSQCGSKSRAVTTKPVDTIQTRNKLVANVLSLASSSERTNRAHLLILLAPTESRCYPITFRAVWEPPLSQPRRRLSLLKVIGLEALG